MRTIRTQFRKSAFALALSIAATRGLVNAQAPSLTSVNKDNSSNRADLKDSIKDNKVGITQLIEAVLKIGANKNTGSNLAPVIGLTRAMPMKEIEVVVSEQAEVKEFRRCFVVYEANETATPGAADQRAVCAYIVKLKHSGSDRQSRYFRVDLNGKLEKAVLSQSKIDEAGKVVRGSGVKTDLDIDSPEVRKTFEAEMKFWLKDWLKKEQKSAAKKTADAAKPTPATAPL